MQPKKLKSKYMQFQNFQPEKNLNNENNIFAMYICNRHFQSIGHSLSAPTSADHVFCTEECKKKKNHHSQTVPWHVVPGSRTLHLWIFHWHLQDKEVCHPFVEFHLPNTLGNHPGIKQFQLQNHTSELKNWHWKPPNIHTIHK